MFCHVLQAGTEDGYINLFQIVDDSIMYEKILDKQEGEVWKYLLANYLFFCDFYWLLKFAALMSFGSKVSQTI